MDKLALLKTQTLTLFFSLLLTAFTSLNIQAQILDDSHKGLVQPDLSNGYSGYFTTIDDKTNKPKSIVHVFVKDDKLYAQVAKLLLKPQDSVCEKCTGDLKNKPVVGMYIVNGLMRDGELFNRGEILDPENGKTYKARIWPDNGNLKVRGYLGIFYRTQEWKPAKNYAPDTPVKQPSAIDTGKTPIIDTPAPDESAHVKKPLNAG